MKSFLTLLFAICVCSNSWSLSSIMIPRDPPLTPTIHTLADGVSNVDPGGVIEINNSYITQESLVAATLSVSGVFVHGRYGSAVQSNDSSLSRILRLGAGGSNTTIQNMCFDGLVASVQRPDGIIVATGCDGTIITSSSLTNCVNAIRGETSPGSLTIQFCRFTSCTKGISFSGTPGVVTIGNNWWGRNSGALPSEFDTISTVGASLVMTLPVQSPMSVSSSRLVTANFWQNSLGQDTRPIGCLTDNVPVKFSVLSGGGSFGPSQVGTTSGAASSTFTAPATPGTVTIRVTCDQQSLDRVITINPVAGISDWASY